MLLGSKTHTAGDTRRWTVKYGDWLDNTATIDQVTVTSSSTSCIVNIHPEILGTDVSFFLSGGVVGERLTVTLAMTDDFGNVKTDTIAFTVIAP